MENISKKDLILGIIAKNKVFGKESQKKQMYIVGDCVLFITVQSDDQGKAVSAFCKNGEEIDRFDKAEDACSISKACKARLTSFKQRSR